MTQVDVLVVGAGFAGAVMAERLASAGRSVVVMESRDHIGGNAFDRLDAHGVLIHPYGPHIFHTNADDVVAYLSRFTGWIPYEHRVLARRDGRLFPVPINRTTLEMVFGRPLPDDDAAAAVLAAERIPVEHPRTSEDVVLSAVGPRLCDLFFRGYTRKQWGVDLSALDSQVTARIPTRTGTDDRYFTDRFQHMPADGFAAMFARMLDHPNIRIELGAVFDPLVHRARARHIVYSGPIDRFYGCRFGALPYRSLRFEHEHLAGVERLQPVAVVNEPDPAVPFTRTTEFKHLTAQRHPGTSIVREFPQDGGDPYYPVPMPASRALYQRYQELAEAETAVTFVGRLAQYRYFNMDQVVASALVKAERLCS